MLILPISSSSPMTSLSKHWKTITPFFRSSSVSANCIFSFHTGLIVFFCTGVFLVSAPNCTTTKGSELLPSSMASRPLPAMTSTKSVPPGRSCFFSPSFFLPTRVPGAPPSGHLSSQCSAQTDVGWLCPSELMNIFAQRLNRSLATWYCPLRHCTVLRLTTVAAVSMWSLPYTLSLMFRARCSRNAASCTSPSSLRRLASISMDLATVACE
mmetsp:Transcript_37925/g.95050  ORF Transcript_37925/g.95050 Transcript_37925/m.95050 type:complete len:211 (-) Transcript_37925:11-643(-)